MIAIGKDWIDEERGDVERALSDYSAVIERPDAPPDRKAQALINRGVTRWHRDEFEASANDYEAVLHVTGVSAKKRTEALFALPEPMIAYCSRGEVLATLTRAFDQGDRQSSEYGGTPHDLLAMVLRRASAEWPQYIKEIAALFIEHGTAQKLGQGIIKSIRPLDEGGYSASHIDVWNSAWQEAGKDCQDLELPLRGLAAAVEVMTSDPKTDRPLLELPQETRRLIRPLLNRSLGETNDVE